MRLLKTVWIRLWDAVLAFAAVLFGRTTRQQLRPTQKVKHAAALQNDLLEVASLLEKMHAWTSRMAARDSRAAKKILDEGMGDAEAPQGEGGGPGTPVFSARDRKLALRRYMTAINFGLPGVSPPPVAPAPEQLEIPQDANGDESEEET